MILSPIAIAGIIFSLIFLIMFFSIIVLCIVTGFKLIKIWGYMDSRYPGIQKQIPAFIRRKDVVKWYSYNREFICSTMLRFLRFEALSRKKSNEYFNKAYRMDIIRRINDKKLENKFMSLIKFSEFRDKIIIYFYFFFIIMLISWLIYLFY